MKEKTTCTTAWSCICSILGCSNSCCCMLLVSVVAVVVVVVGVVVFAVTVTVALVVEVNAANELD